MPGSVSREDIEQIKQRLLASADQEWECLAEIEAKFASIDSKVVYPSDLSKTLSLKKTNQKRYDEPEVAADPQDPEDPENNQDPEFRDGPRRGPKTVCPTCEAADQVRAEIMIYNAEYIKLHRIIKTEADILSHLKRLTEITRMILETISASGGKPIKGKFKADTLESLSNRLSEFKRAARYLKTHGRSNQQIINRHDQLSMIMIQKKADIAEITKDHPYCSYCDIRLGPGHEITEYVTVDGLNFCPTCPQIQTRPRANSHGKHNSRSVENAA